MAPAARIDELRAQVERIGPLRDIDLVLPGSGMPLRILAPDDLDALLDVAADDPEQNLPHWAELWPSGIALADEILAAPAVLRGRPALEIGSGLGVTAIAALRAGAELTVADYASQALDLCRYNALRDAGREPAAVQVNWRRPSAEFLARMGGGFPVVLAADVLYERRDVEPLLALLDRVVAPGGVLWLAEPGRDVARIFLERAAEHGWQGHGAATEHFGPWPDPRDEGVRVAVHRLQRTMGARPG